jgi:hypothetical protein
MVGERIEEGPLIAAGPFERDGLWMTFVELVEAGGHHEPLGSGDDAERFGRALRELHEALAPYDGDLVDFADLGRDIERLRGALRPSAELSAERIDSLGERLAALRETLFASLPVQALPGDALVGNLLRTPGGLLWNDFEDTFRGPVGWDVSGYLISLQWRGADDAFVDRALDAYGGPDREALAPFTAGHYLYDEIWKAYDAQRRG